MCGHCKFDVTNKRNLIDHKKMFRCRRTSCRAACFRTSGGCRPPWSASPPSQHSTASPSASPPRPRHPMPPPAPAPPPSPPGGAIFPPRPRPPPPLPSRAPRPPTPAPGKPKSMQHGYIKTSKDICQQTQEFILFACHRNIDDALGPFPNPIFLPMKRFVRKHKDIRSQILHFRNCLSSGHFCLYTAGGTVLVQCQNCDNNVKNRGKLNGLIINNLCVQVRGPAGHAVPFFLLAVLHAEPSPALPCPPNQALLRLEVPGEAGHWALLPHLTRQEAGCHSSALTQVKQPNTRSLSLSHVLTLIYV